MLSKKDVLKMSNEEMYNLLLPIIKSFSNKNKKEFNDDEFDTIVLNTIDETKMGIKDGEDFIELFKKNLLMSLTTSKDLSGTNSFNDYLKEISTFPLLSNEEEKEEFIKLKNGNLESKEKIINSNLRLVIYIAKMYINKGLSLEDLIQEGNLGLLKAVDMFDIDKGFKFSTYAFWWIKQAVTRAIADKGRAIRLPVHVVESITNYKKAVKKLSDRFNRNPTHEEIAEEMNVPLEKVLELEKHQYEIVSLSMPIGEEKDTQLGDFIPSENKAPDEETFDKMLPEKLKDALLDSNLTDRELTVIMYRFGFIDNKEFTLEEIGSKFGLTRERIRQIETKALIKLKRSKSFRQMSWWYLNDGNSKDLKKAYFNVPKIPRSDSLYTMLYNYSKEQVDYAVSRLSTHEKELINLRFGPDLKSPITTNLTKQECSRLFRSIIPKLEKMLSTMTQYNSINREPRNKQDALEQKKKSLLDATSEDNIEEIEFNYIINKLKNMILQTNNSYVQEAYIQLLHFMNSKEFKKLLTELSVKEAVIVSLYTGLINDKYFTTEELMVPLFTGHEEDPFKFQVG